MTNLTREQIQANINALEKQGAKPQEIQEWLDSLRGTRKKSVYGSKEEMAQILSQEKARGEQASKVGALDVAKQLPFGVAQTFKQIPRFITSAVEVPKTVMTGQASQKTYKLPLFGSFQSYQTEAENIAKKTGSAGKAIATTFPKAIVGGLETLGAARVAQKVVKTGLKGFSSLKQSKQAKEALEVITNQKLSKGEAITALKKTTKVGGVAEKGKIFKTFEATPDYDDIEAAKAAQGLIKKSSTPTKNIKNLSEEIAKTSTNKVRPQIQEANRALTEADWVKLDSMLDDVQPNVFTKSNDTAFKTFNNIKQNLKDFLKGNAGDLDSLYNSEIAYDRMVLNESKGKAFEQISPAYEAIRGSRRVARNFLAEQMKNPQVFLSDIKYEHNLFTAIEKIAEKNSQIIGKGIWKTLKLAHPIIAKGIKLGGTAIGGYVGYRGLKSIF